MSESLIFFPLLLSFAFIFRINFGKVEPSAIKMYLFFYRFSELSSWLSSKESQLRLLRNRVKDPIKYGQVKSNIEVKTLF